MMVTIDIAAVLSKDPLWLHLADHVRHRLVHCYMSDSVETHVRLTSIEHLANTKPTVCFFAFSHLLASALIVSRVLRARTVGYDQCINFMPFLY